MRKAIPAIKPAPSGDLVSRHAAGPLVGFNCKTGVAAVAHPGANFASSLRHPADPLPSNPLSCPISSAVCRILDDAPTHLTSAGLTHALDGQFSTAQPVGNTAAPFERTIPGLFFRGLCFSIGADVYPAAGAGAMYVE